MGNYADELFHAKFPLNERAENDSNKNNWLAGYDDGFATTSPVGAFPANAHGLYDMGGNVWQWCEDWWNAEKTDRVLRGGSWMYSDRAGLRSSHRNHFKPNVRDINRGFRCVLEPAPSAAAASPQPAPAVPKTPPNGSTTWTDTTDRTVQGVFKAIEGDKVVLEVGGKATSLPLASLSAESQKMARDLAAAGVAKTTSAVAPAGDAAYVGTWKIADTNNTATFQADHTGVKTGQNGVTLDGTWEVTGDGEFHVKWVGGPSWTGRLSEDGQSMTSLIQGKENAKWTRVKP